VVGLMREDKRRTKWSYSCCWHLKGMWWLTHVTVATYHICNNRCQPRPA